MPRVRRPESEYAGLVPVELLDGDHPVWQVAKSTRQWLKDHDLSTDGVANSTLAQLHPLERHKAAASRWTVQRGKFTTYGSSPVRYPDLAWMREAGIPSTFHRRLRATLKAAGVQVT